MNLQQYIQLIWDSVQPYLPWVQENIAILTAIIVVLIVWMLKKQIVRQNRRLIQEIERERAEFRGFLDKNMQTSVTGTPNAVAYPNLMENRILVYQELVNLKAEWMSLQHQLSENHLPAKRYYHYFKEFRDVVTHNRFYLTQETERLFSEIMQTCSPQLLKLKHLENEFADLASEPSADRYTLEQLIEQETVVLETFQRQSEAQMDAFLERIDIDVLHLRSDLEAR